MGLIITYIVLSLVLARFLDKKKYRTAIIAHSVIFIVLLACMFVFSSDSVAVFISRSVIGDRAYEIFREAIAIDDLSPAEIFLPMMVIEIVMVLTGIAATVLLAKEVIESVAKSLGQYENKSLENEKAYFRDPTKERDRQYKIYLKNCVMLC